MTPNRWLVILLAILVGLACLAGGTAVVAYPQEAIARFDTAWLRAILLLTCALLAFLLALELYGFWYDPPPVRMTRRVMAYVMTVGTAASISPLGLFGLQHVEGFGVKITMQEVGIASGLCLAATFTALLLLLHHYTWCYVQAQGPTAPREP